MKITCRDCGATIPAENINVQEMVALCENCNNLFALDQRLFARKRKRVIPKRPARVTLHTGENDDRIALSYRMALGPGPKVMLFGSAIGSVILTSVLFGMLSERAPGGAILIVVMLLLFALYILATIITTTTTISADDDMLQITSGPLPFPISDDKALPLDDIQRIYAEQTLEAYSGGIPANNVYAEMNDSRRIPVVTSVPYDYAHYLALLLDDYLHANREIREQDFAEFDDGLDIESALDDALSPPQQRAEQS